MLPSYIVLNGGFGNQLWQLAFAHKLAESRPVHLIKLQSDRIDSIHLDNGAELISKIISHCSHRINFQTYNTANPFIRGKFIPESNWSRIWSRRIIDSRNLDWQEFEKIDTTGNFIHLGFFQSLKYLREEVMTVLKEMQRLIPSVRDLNRDYISQDYAILHLRGGDYYQDRHKNSFGVLDQDYYVKLVQKIYSLGFEKAYVVTDDWKNARERLKAIDRIELMPLEGLSELATMFSLSGAAVVGIANSSFSWWG